jgi:3-oxoacyl-[acyl-carrier protein] reductase
MVVLLDFDKIHIGDSREMIKKITEADIERFVHLTGDVNPLHIDPEFAAQTSFKDIVVHGMLGASFISTIIGTQLPGAGALWVSHNFDFLLPVRLDDVLTISCTVTGKHDRERLLDLDARIVNQNNKTVLKGSGRVKMLIATTPDTTVIPEDGLSTVALVTGGSGGIGASICRRLARDGFQVVLNYNRHSSKADSIVEAITTAGGTAVAVQADVATEEGAMRLVEQASQHFGPVGVLVNNASPSINPQPLTQMTWQQVQHHLDIQLKATFLLSQKCSTDMVNRKAGRIINITSQIVRGTPTLHWTAYGVAKAALAGFSRHLATELGPNGVTVNCVAPGMTETALVGDIPLKQQMIVGRQTPLRRLAQPEDIAAAVSYLASEDAKFVTGHSLNVNGGMLIS